MLNEYISQAEAKGHIVSEKYYDALISNERKNIATLKQEQAALIKARDEAVASGAIEKGSEEWNDMSSEIDNVTQSIEESTTAIIEFENAIRDIEWEVFDLIQERISNITEEADFLIELLSSEKLFDDKGQLTNEGMATVGLHGQNYNMYMHQADDYGKQADEISKQLESDPYDQELIAKRQEYLDLQRESILAAQQEKEAIRDLVEEGINLELDSLQELIDEYNDALDSQKDLYEYQKNVEEQIKNIASLEKQWAAYAGDDSEEAQQKRQQISADLEEARKDLEETEFDKYIQDTEEILDNLYLDYETILNQRLDNIDALVESMIAEVNANAGTISDTLTTTADSVGYTLSEELQKIWGAGGTVLEMYGKFDSGISSIDKVLGEIKTQIDNMTKETDKEAGDKVDGEDPKPSSGQDPEPVITPIVGDAIKKESNSNTTTKSITVGGLINAGSAKIYDYAGDTSGERQYYRNDPIYKVLSEKNGYLLVRYHKLSSGATGWFKKSDVKAYATGVKKIGSDDMAWTQENGQEYIVRPSDGAILTPLAKNDSVLTSAASSNIWNMANSPAEFIKDNLNLGTANVPNNSNVQSSYTQNLDKVVFNLPNVKNYEELLSAMQKDKNFERLILSMSIDRLAGKSNLAKGKAIR